MLRRVLGPATPRATPLRTAARTYRRRHAILGRAAVVLILLGCFLGSALFVGQKSHAPAAVATIMVADPVATGSIGHVGRPRDGSNALSLGRSP
jgi:hypothetical protein